MIARDASRRVHHWRDLDEHQRASLLARPASSDPALRDAIAALIDDVRARGDAAIREATLRHDGWDAAGTSLRVPDAEIARAHDSIAEPVAGALRLAIANVRAFNLEVRRRRQPWRATIGQGQVVGQRHTPLASAGLFVPAGKGSFPSVLIQIATPAVVAGVATIAVAVPPDADGRVDPAILFVAAELGIATVLRANGPAAIAGLAFGTETFPRVEKVLGPGSPAVQMAQTLCQAHGAHAHVTMGPTESMVIADSDADPDLLAADILTEAEHGHDSSVWLVSDDARLIAKVDVELDRRLAALERPRRDYATSAARANGGAILVDDLAQAVEVADRYAPEHLLIVARDDEAIAARVRHAGEILLGPYTPFAIANYVAGTPAALPTSASARVIGGVTADTFLKDIAIVRVASDALPRLAPATHALARHEGFPAHAAAIAARWSGAP